MFLTLQVVLLLATPTEWDTLWDQFHAAGDPALRAGIWNELRERGWPEDYDATLARLRDRNYPHDVPTGLIRLRRRGSDGREYPYTLLVPTTYDPLRAYPVQVVLHGSTRRPAWRRQDDHWPWTEPFRSEEQITVFPAAWEEAMWWSRRQVENLRAILDQVRARYHVDPNRCHLTGVSDGGTGTFYHALRAPTPWAAFFPLIGHPWVLGNEAEGVEGDMFAANLSGRSLFVVNGEEDRLYPARALRPYLDLFTRAGADLRVKSKPGGHTVRWWPEEAADFAAFRAAHPRNPWPDRLVWETEDPATNGRAFWVAIHRVGDTPAPDPDPMNTVLFPELDPPTRAQAFPRRRASGRLELRRDGDTIVVSTRNVSRFELLLGVDAFDLNTPLVIFINQVEHRYLLRPDLSTLMEWAVRDGDPTMLVAATVQIDVP